MRKDLLIRYILPIALLALWWRLDIVFTNYLQFSLRTRVEDHLRAQATSVQNAVNTRLALLDGLRSYIDASPDPAQFAAGFPQFAASLYTSAAGTQWVLAAPGGIVRQVYPPGLRPVFEGSAVPGYTAGDGAGRDAASLRRVNLADPTITDSGDCVTVVVGVDRDSLRWGLIAMRFRTDPLLEEANLDRISRTGIALALTDRRDHLFFGDSAVLTASPVRVPVDLPGGSWTLAGVPAEGWSAATRGTQLLFRGSMLIIMVLVLLISHLITRTQTALQRAVEKRTREITAINSDLRREVDERRRAEERLREVNTTLATIIHSSPWRWWCWI